MFTNQNEQFTNLTLSFLRVLRWIAPCPSPLRLKRVYTVQSVFHTPLVGVVNGTTTNHRMTKHKYWYSSIVCCDLINVLKDIPEIQVKMWHLGSFTLTVAMANWKKKHYKPFFSSLSLQNVASFYISKKNCIFTGKISIFPSCDLSPPTTPLENCSFYHFNSLGKFPVSPVRPMIFNGWVWRLWVWLFSGATAFKSTDIDSKLRVFLKPLRVEIFSDVHLSFTLPFSCR